MVNERFAFFRQAACAMSMPFKQNNYVGPEHRTSVITLISEMVLGI